MHKGVIVSKTAYASTDRYPAIVLERVRILFSFILRSLDAIWKPVFTTAG